jgi:hypothetical protein
MTVLDELQGSLRAVGDFVALDLISAPSFRIQTGEGRTERLSREEGHIGKNLVGARQRDASLVGQF